MTLSVRSLAFFGACFILGGCGPQLGSYRVDDVSLVDSRRPGQIDPDADYTGSEQKLIRIQFSSRTDLEDASRGGDLYVTGDSCPVRNDFQLAILGPFYGDQPRLLSTKVTSYQRGLDGRIQMSVDSENRHPARDPKTGRYIYTAYLIPSAPATQLSTPYDLRRWQADLCLRIDHPGYYLIPSRSKEFKIDRQTIQRVLQGS